MSTPKNTAPPMVKYAKPAVAEAHYAPITFRDQEFMHDQDAKFTETVMNVAQGLELALGIVNSSILDRTMNADAGPDDQVTPVLSAFDTDVMIRFAITSASLLAHNAEARLERFKRPTS